jgi:hypothetical protein
LSPARNFWGNSLSSFALPPKNHFLGSRSGPQLDDHIRNMPAPHLLSLP